MNSELNSASDARKAAAVMIVVAGLEAWPLVLIARSPNGFAALERFLGWGTAIAPTAAWIAALAIAMIYAFASISSLPSIGRRAFDFTALKVLAVPFALVTGTFEELFFRRWLMDSTQGYGVVVQIVLSAIIFGAAHGIWGLFGRNVRAALTAMAFTGVLGLALAVVYVLDGRQVAPCIWSHILINLMIEPWLLLGVMELRHPEAVQA